MPFEQQQQQIDQQDTRECQWWMSSWNERTHVASSLFLLHLLNHEHEPWAMSLPVYRTDLCKLINSFTHSSFTMIINDLEFVILDHSLNLTDWPPRGYSVEYSYFEHTTNYIHEHVMMILEQDLWVGYGQRLISSNPMINVHNTICSTHFWLIEPISRGTHNPSSTPMNQ